MGAWDRESIQRSRLVVSAAVCIVVAGLIHLLIVPTHWAHAPAHGLFFAAAGLAELAWAAAFWRRPSVRLIRLGTLLAGGLIVLWVITRLAQVPFTGEPEAVDVYGVVSKLAEGLAIGVLVALARQPSGFREAGRPAWRGIASWLVLSVIAGVLTYQVGLAAELLFPWLAEREGGHVHAESALDQEPAVRLQPVDVQKPVAVARTSTPLPATSPTPEAAMRDEPRSQETQLEPPEATSTVVPAELVPTVTFQGSGEAATDNVLLAPGLAEFHFAHPADTPFAFFLLNLQGDHLALLANSTTAVTGTQVFGVKTAGEYYLHVIARDDWTVSVAQPGDQALAARATSATSLQGDAPSISAPMRLAAGPVRLAWTHRGLLAFELVLWHADGRRAVQIVRTTGDAQGEKTITVPADGIYVLNVMADGPWTVSLASP